MLTKADDYPIHQLPIPVSEVGSERNFYDRYFFNGYNQGGDVFFAVALFLASWNQLSQTKRHTGAADRDCDDAT